MSAGPYRLDRGGQVERGRALTFHFDGKAFQGFEGDTLASALLGNGVRLAGRSFKFHRPRGVFSCGAEEPNALVQLDSGATTVPSSRATLVPLRAGLAAFSGPGKPVSSFDFLRILDFTAPLWAAGFYNRTFKWPSWHTYEDMIRRMAGCGAAPTERDPDRYEAGNLHCDVLVVGGGEAGLRAASAAAGEGARVVLVEQDSQLGGSASWSDATIEGVPGRQWARTMGDKLSHSDAVRVFTRTMAVGYYDRGIVTLVETNPSHGKQAGAPRERYWTVRARRVVLATGAIEQPLIFVNNDRPGIVLASAAHQYLKRYAVAVGRRVLLATNNDSAYAVARDLKAAGVEVVGIADSRHDVPLKWVEELRRLSIPLFAGSIPVDSSGFSALSGVTLGSLSKDSKRVEGTQRLSCDALAVSGGWNPTLHLFSQAGGKLTFNETTHSFRAASSPADVTLAGAAAGASLNGSLGISVSPAGNTRRKWVDLKHDVTVSDLELALRENYTSIEHVKRYTTVGMANDQGKTANVAALGIVAGLRGVKAAAIGHTTFRPPYMPTTLGAIAGRAIGDMFAPSRLLPMHDWHAANGALIEDYGEWKRPSVYRQSGESRHDAIRRESRATRTGAGLLDASPLGKIEIHGPDAREFLDRFYINNLKTLKPGIARYGIMLRENGIVFDDGTVVMLAPDHFLITTTSGAAGRVVQWLEEWHQCEWPHLRLAIMPVTEQWGTVTIAGPKAREILEQLGGTIDLSNAAFPHLGMREGRLLGQPARIYRVSFTGELSYEINVPLSVANTLWHALLEKGKPHGIAPVGLDSIMLMRLEKGFLHIGSDTDGTTVPDDVGYGGIAAKKAADFVGKRSLILPENVRPDRLQLVGLMSDTDIVIGSHLRLPNTKEATDGWVTSAGRATLTGEPIALALVRAGRKQVGTQVTLHDQGRVTHAKVVNPPFFDPTGARMNA